MVFKSISWTALGTIVPIIISFPLIGFISRKIGVEEFGLFLLFFTFVSISSFLDLGISRAVVREVALCKNNEKGSIVYTSTIFVILISLVIFIILIIGHEIFLGFLNVPSNLKQDASRALYYISACVPLLLISGVWAAVPEGELEFKKISIFKTFSGVFVILTPFLFLFFERSLSLLCLGLLFSRLFILLYSFSFVYKNITRAHCLSFSHIYKMFLYGRWLTVTNIVGSIMVYGDRFLISYIIGARAAAFYSISSELVSKILILPNIVAKPLYPIIASDQKLFEEKEKIVALFLFGISFFISILGLFFSSFFIEYWLGYDYVEEVSSILRIFLLGFFFNSISQISYIKIQAVGRSDVAALIHLVEVVPYIICFYFFTLNYGVFGAAWVWSIRNMIDCLLMMFFSKRIFKYEK